MWPFNLSVRLPIVDLVGRYPTNYLIGREPIFQRIAPLIIKRCRSMILCGISSRFQLLSPSERQVAHVLLTRPPLIREQAPFTVRLACVRRAASVRPEPGSNSLKFVSNREFPHGLICSNKQTQRSKTQSVYPKLLFLISLPNCLSEKPESTRS